MIRTHFEKYFWYFYIYDFIQDKIQHFKCTSISSLLLGEITLTKYNKKEL